MSDSACGGTLRGTDTRLDVCGVVVVPIVVYGAVPMAASSNWARECKAVSHTCWAGLLARCADVVFVRLLVW